MITDTVSPFMKKDSTAHIPKSMQKFIHEMNIAKSSAGVASNNKKRNGNTSIGAETLPIKRQQQTSIRNFGIPKTSKKKSVKFSSPMTDFEEPKATTAPDEFTTSSILENKPKTKFNYKKSNLSNANMVQSTNTKITSGENLYNMDSDELISMVDPIVEFANQGKHDAFNPAVSVANSGVNQQMKNPTINSSQWTTFNEMVQSLPFNEKELGGSDFEEISAVFANDRFGSNSVMQSQQKTWKEKLQIDNQKLDDMLQRIAAMNNTITKFRKEISKFGYKK